MAAGTWKLNVAKSTFSPGPAPVSATVVISDDSKIQYSDDLGEGKTSSWSVTPNSDGTPATITGMDNATLVEKKVDDRHVEDTWKFGDMTETGKSVLSKDGKKMTYTLTGTTPDGQEIHNLEIFEKQ
jgi:hypothetical protein